MKNLDPMLLTDFYKLHHRIQYPEDTELVYSTWVPRGSRKPGITKVVFSQLQGFIKEFFLEIFQENFFDKPKKVAVKRYLRIVKYALGVDAPETKHLENLHDLGYLPVEIRAIKEGTSVPIRTPMMTIHNTDKRFFWLTNFLETLMSCEIWGGCTGATISKEYKKILNKYAMQTIGNTEFVPFQGHNFSFRGMMGLWAAMKTGHLLNFVGTDTIPEILYMEEYYNADIEKELVGTSIPATEHSVMCAGGKDSEFETYKRLITKVYPSGMLSIVSDTWDLWKVLTDIIAKLSDEIMARDGKIVIRPDSGDPVLIVCGDPNGKTEMEQKGVVECLWDIFGGETSEMGYKVLDPHIGCIYGDAITLERCDEICQRLKAKGFASTNMVFGIGSYTYQFNTRDTFGFALKSTLCIVGGEERQIYKDPKTDDGLKKSQCGAVTVFKDGSEIHYQDRMTFEKRKKTEDLLELVFRNGKLYRDESLAEIRGRLDEDTKWLY